MRDFDETAGADLDTEYYETAETNWLSAKDADKFVLIAMSASKGKSQWGDKMYFHVCIEGDEEAVEYTISLSDRSAAFHQLEQIVDQEGALAFPFRCKLVKAGNTYKITSAPKAQKPRYAEVAEPESRPVSPRPAPRNPRRPAGGVPTNVSEEAPF